MSVEHTAEHTVEFEISGEWAWMDVEFTGNMRVENDSFDHEFGTEVKPDYLVVDGDATWNKKKFTKIENAIISTWYSDKGFEEVEETILSSYRKQCEAYAEY